MFIKKQYDPCRDRSLKQKIDEDILPLVDAVNSLDDFYTTSSCSGRTVLLERGSVRKCDARWIYSTHKRADPEAMIHALGSLSECPVWFKQESMILHVCCKTMESALALLGSAHMAGFKRSGIICASKRIMVEITGTERVDTIIADKGRLLVDKDYIEVLVREANIKMDANRARILKLARLVNSEKL